MDPVSDNAIMQKVREGDVEKMGLLFDRHNKSLFRFLFNMTRQKELSEDMVQNVFLRMLKYPDNFKGFGEFRTWMYHIARNVLIDHFRKNAKMPIHNEINNHEASVETDQLPDASLEKKEDLKKLEKAMQRLADGEREILLMCRFEELKYSEIAEILNITEGAVKVRVHRALNQLKANFFEIEKT